MRETMERARVICQMMTTIDGKISIEWDEEENPDYAFAGEEYERLMDQDGQAYGCGRETFQSELEADLSQYRGVPVEYKDRVILPQSGEGLVVAFDRWGKLRWESPILSFDGSRRDRILEAVTEQVPPEFLAYLDDLGIGYILAGKEDFDPLLFLQKIKALYHVDTFILSGGAEINAVFLKAGLVDEVCLVIGPAVDGVRNTLTSFGSEDVTGFPKYFKLKEVRDAGHNVAVLRWIRA